jgi:uncharacterized Zn-binding protein involved in type VI secretion
MSEEKESGDKKKEEDKGISPPKGEVKKTHEFDKKEKKGDKEWSQKKTEDKPEDEKKDKTTKKVDILSKDWVKDKEGYAGPHGEAKTEGKYGKAEASGGVLYGKAEAKSKLSLDLDKKEAELTVIKAEAQGSVVHGEAKGELDLGSLLMAPFKDKPPHTPPTPGAGPMAARVGDLTGHGTPLAPGIGSPNVLIGGMPAWRATADMHLCPIVKGVVPDVGGVVMVGAPTVLINNMMACRMGDMVVEIPGGPNPIAMGCPTVMIGPAAGSASGDGGDKGTGLKATGKATGDVLTAKAEAELSVVANKDKVMATAKAGAMAAVLKGNIDLGLSIPIPFTDHAITLGASGEGTLLSAGAEGEASAGWSKEKGYQAKIGGKVGVGLGGVGVGFSVGFK